MSPPILQLRDLSKDYRGVPAVRKVSIDAYAGEVHALLGENGAGKSTLTKMAVGTVEPTSGEIFLAGKKMNFAGPKDALQAGIVMVYQENSLVPALSVAQNLFLGAERFFNRLRNINIAARQIMQSLNFDVEPTATVASLNVAQRQMVEIARAVRQEARVIIFDEPTAALTPEEKRHFFALLERLKAAGTAIIFITHALEEALVHADRITVLRDGEVVTGGKASEFDRDSVIRAMVGRSLTEELHPAGAGPRKPRRAGRKLLSVENVSMGAAVRNTSFSLYAGQVTGMFGLVGSGRSEVARIISGGMKRNRFHGGQIKLDGVPIRFTTPRDAVDAGIVYVTEDRKVDGFFESMTIATNIGIGRMAADPHPLALVRKSEVAALAKEWMERLNVRAIDDTAHVIELSGGNQQKVVIAKSLVQEPKLVILDEPTRGVDVGAIAEIHALINGLADQGMAVVVISSYLPEILSLSDRILVTRLGRMVEEFDLAEATEEKIMYAAVH